MEHRTELEQLLLNGLPDGERRHVVKTINLVTAEKLRRLQSEVVADIARPTP